LVGVKVNVGVLVFGGVKLPISIEVGMYVAVKVGVLVGGLYTVGVRDGVLVSAANPVGKAFPMMGMDIRNERALADTTLIG
jgi:hypothetical protein